jgi:hypothetical protein
MDIAFVLASSSSDTRLTHYEYVSLSTSVNDEIATNTAFLLQGGPDIGMPEGGVIVEHPGFGSGPGFVGPSVTSYGAHANGDFRNMDLYPNGVLRIQVIFDCNARGKPKNRGKKSS